jgi:Domain of unknown function (DUF2760)
MTPTSLSFFQRLPLALSNLFRILFDPHHAARVYALDHAPAATMPTPAPPAPPAPPPAPSHAPITAALQLMALLQRDARLIDFVQEDLSNYSDADIGAAARVVHEGCHKVFHEHFTLLPIRTEPEGSAITLPVGYDVNTIRLTGNVVGNAPFTGSLSHAGWRASAVNLPKLAAGHDAHVLAQAEVAL